MEQHFDHLEIRPVTVVKRRRRAFFVRGAVQDHRAHGTGLSRAATEVSKQLSQRAASSNLKTGYLTVRTTMPLSEQSLKQIGLVPVEYKDKKTIIVSTDDLELYRFRSKLAEYRAGPSEGKRFAPHEGVFGNIEAISLRNPEEKLGSAFRHITIQPTHKYKVDVHVLPRADSDERRLRFRTLTKSTVQDLNGEVLDKDENRFTARLHLRGRSLQRLVETWDDIEVDGVPLVKTSVDEVSTFDADDVTDLAGPPEDATGICIIDSGVDDQHQFLTLAHKRSRLFFRDLGHLDDTKGHGTKVAGIAVYGDVRECLARKSFRPEVFFCSAKIIEPDEKGHDETDDDLLENKFRSIVHHFREDCRVFNLSLAFAQAFDGSSIQEWTAEIDRLSREYDVLFVTCAGNIETELIESQLQSGVGFPDYLSRPESRLYPPGNAMNALSVGSVAHNNVLQKKRRGRKVIAGVMEPSPFSRAGLGIEEAIKPDVCEYGGNYFVDPDGTVSGDDPLMGLPTTARGGGMSTAVGTSFAAPKVSHLAAKLFNRFRGRSSNLVRALIVNSTLMPPGAQARSGEIAKHYGYGIPKAERAMYSTSQRVTMFYEGHILPDTCEVFAIPVTPNLFGGRGKKSISVTLAYDPEVNPLNSVQYCGIELEWKLAKKGSTLEEVVQELDAELEQEDRSASGSIWWTSGAQFGSRLRSRGTVQRDVFSWTRGSVTSDLYVAVIARRKWSPEDTPQRFALVVTVECSEDQTDIYNQIRSRTRVRPRVRLGVKQ